MLDRAVLFSPHLFVLVMSVIDHVVSRNITARTRNARFERLDVDTVYHADDALTIITCTQACNNLLHEIEKIISSIWAKIEQRQVLLCCNER